MWSDRVGFPRFGTSEVAPTPHWGPSVPSRGAVGAWHAPSGRVGSPSSGRVLWGRPVGARHAPLVPKWVSPVLAPRSQWDRLRDCGSRAGIAPARRRQRAGHACGALAKSCVCGIACAAFAGPIAALHSSARVCNVSGLVSHRPRAFCHVQLNVPGRGAGRTEHARRAPRASGCAGGRGIWLLPVNSHSYR